MPTPDQQALIEAISHRLQAEPRVQAAWLAGSLGKGEGDAFSDVDVLALVGEGPVGAVSAELARDLSAIAEPVLVNNPLRRRGAERGHGRVAAIRHQPDHAGPARPLPRRRLTPLFNRGDAEPPRPPQPPYRPSPERVLQIVNEFIRVLGLTSVVVGRQEYVTAQSGVDILRRLTIDLMVEQNRIGPADRGGALHANRLLTLEQRVLLSSLPPVGAERGSILRASVELARLFLPRAKALAHEVGAPWPAAFEQATRAHLERSLGLTI
ncbi:MAG: hypothetical protein WDM92_14535 [Caulobacteraceae bacterium]